MVNIDNNVNEKIKLIKIQLTKVDDFSFEFIKEIDNLTELHKTNGGYIEYSYISHFNQEIMGLSNLLQYLLKDQQNKKYSFFVVRSSIEILLYLEYILRISKEGDHKILTLLSKDMAQSVASIDSAIPTDKNHIIHTTIKKIGLVNKILKTNFDLEKIKSNSKVFPDIKSLCTSSILNIKDSKGVDMYHIYSMYSQANHLRFGNYHSTAENMEQLELSSLEYFIEIYIKFYQQILNTSIFSKEYNNKLEAIKISLGLNW